MTMKPKKQSTQTDANLPEATLSELKQILKDRGDVGPKYLFNAVKEAIDVKDYKYVFWLDLMGARNAMKLSLSRAARSVMKIHAAALLAKQKHPDLEINPVMDGVYGYVEKRDLLETGLTEIMTALGNVFVQEKFSNNRFMVRAGVAYGPIIPGKDLAAGAPILQQNQDFLGGTAIGMAISQAYEAEGYAPPFGVYIHESARAFAPRMPDSYPYLTNLWSWFDEDDALTWGIRRTLVEHFDWLAKNPVSAQYDAQALIKHRALADEYFKLYELTAPKTQNNQ